MVSLLLLLLFDHKKFSKTYDVQHDTFRVSFLIIPSIVLALIIHVDWSLGELLWSFSEFLEVVAILPQLFLLQRSGESEALTWHYMFALVSKKKKKKKSQKKKKPPKKTFLEYFL